MNAASLLAVLGIGVGAAGLAGLVVRQRARLASRVRPYTMAGRGVDVRAPATTAALPGVFGPPLRALLGRVGRVLEQRGDEQLALLLRQAGEHSLTPEDARVRQVAHGAVYAAAGGLLVGVLAHVPLAALAAAGAGFTLGVSRWRRGVERAVAQRATRLRLELYTVNQLLAMHARTGAGVVQAVQRVVDRGRGVVVEELADVVTWTRSGMGEADAFRRAAELTAEPSATRTYLMLAAGVERGADLSSGLLALSEDIRDARREQLHKDAVRRRAAMLVPTIGILAPIMLLFIAAPLPSIVLGHH